MRESKLIHSYYLKSTEKIIEYSEVSKASLGVIWLSVPALFLIYYIATLPVRIQKYILAKASESVLGTSLPSFEFEMPTVLKVLIAIPVVILVLTWLGWAIVTTKKMSENELLYTDSNLYIYVSGNIVSSNFKDIKNVIAERSVFGRLLGYGNLNITLKSTSLTVRSIKNPDHWRKILLELSDEAQK